MSTWCERCARMSSAAHEYGCTFCGIVFIQIRDCETILSTKSNLYNHPCKISKAAATAANPPNKIPIDTLVSGHGWPLLVHLDSRMRWRGVCVYSRRDLPADYVGASSGSRGAPPPIPEGDLLQLPEVNTTRRKGETAEERR